MDLSNMLNGPSRPKENHLRPTMMGNDKTALYQLSASLNTVKARDPKRLNGSLKRDRDTTTVTTITPSPQTSSILFGDPLPRIKEWRPKLSLRSVPIHQHKRIRLDPQYTQPEIELETHEIMYQGFEPRTLLLEPNYELQRVHARGVFVMLAKRNIQPTFIFRLPEHAWVKDLSGLRKTASFEMKTQEGEVWELHIKPSRDTAEGYMFGFLIRQIDMVRNVKDCVHELVRHRKLPLVLDLDDTLVRLVGNENGRFVPEADIPKCEDRVAVLKDGKRVVLTERVREFLEWAQQLFDISVCSLGDQNYVENVIDVLDPNRVWIKGILYSARAEHDYIRTSPEPGRPPKDLQALYSFCALRDQSLGSGFALPLILDDETRMWPAEQHDNIIEVKGQLNSEVWTVSLFPVVQETLLYVHTEFFRQYDTWYARSQDAEHQGLVYPKPPPSAISIYKTYLRHILRDMIAAKKS
ncbi:hypothetical protein RMCBS344292_07085 [Rhizopus microsporus]|nr:hypothetical protein RMCBS344292_07085 [Rhizopus microsporus]